MQKLLLRIKHRWMNYLKKLEKANKKMYGSKRLDCCDLNVEKKH